MRSFEDALLESGNAMRRGYALLFENSGKIIALITALAAILLTFAEVGLPSVVGAELGADMLIMLAACYIIFFSLEDAGERLGRSTEVYKKAHLCWEEAAKEVRGEDIGSLRDFCIRYSKEELEYRRRAAQMAAGLSEAELENIKSVSEPRARRAARRIARMKPIPLTPLTLLGGEAGARSELDNPERHKLPRLVLSLLPTTLCMLFTVSVMVSVKDNMTAAGVIEAILKLSTLPIVGLKGYSGGYEYVTNNEVAWLETKSRLIEAFLKTQKP